MSEKVKYLGDGNNPPAITNVLGIKFKLGQSVIVEDAQKLKKFKSMEHAGFYVGDAEPVCPLKIKVETMTTNELKTYVEKNKLTPQSRKKTDVQNAVFEFLKGAENA